MRLMRTKSRERNTLLAREESWSRATSSRETYWILEIAESIRLKVSVD